MVLSLADFIEYLRQRNFNVGVDHLLRAHILLDTIDQDYPSPELLETLHHKQPATNGPDALITDQPPDKLKLRLCPLFAVNREEQLRFYKAFDDYVNHIEWRGPGTGDNSPEPTGSWKQPAIALSILAVAITGTLLWINFARETETDWGPAPRPSSTATPASTQSPAPTLPLIVVTTPTGASSPPQTPTPSPSPTPPPSRSPAASAYVAVFVAAMVLFVLYEVSGHLIRQRLPPTQQSKSPPFWWPLTVNKPLVKLYRSDQFFQAVRRLRRRRIREYHRLNIHATVAATIRSLGYPSFRYKPDSNIPEYLMLIDRISFRDHQAHLFNELFKALRREGLYITRFFYERDPRHCFDEEGKEFQHLAQLRSKYFDHRLLIFGDCDKLLDPSTGRLAEWAKMFSAWHDRAILTPISPALWSFRETNLVSQFSILPATVEGLNELSNTFAPPITRELGDWEYSEADVLPRDLNAENVVAELRPRLGEDVFQWLCACAVYPELQWNLTVLIGSLPCMKADLVTEENLVRLVRLPWFSAGTLPDDVRLALTQALDHEKEAAVRATIIDLLANDAPPDGTFAADTHNVELALQTWLISRIPENLRRLRLALKNIPANEVLNDQLLVSYLKRIPTVMSRLLPLPLQEGLYKHGLPIFGFKTAAHFLLMLLLVILVSLGMRTGALPGLYSEPTSTPIPTPDPSPLVDVDDKRPRPGDGVLRPSPSSAKRGSDFQMRIDIEPCVPGSFKNAALEVPAGSQIKIGPMIANDCTLTARVSIPSNAPLGTVEFLLTRAGSTTSIPFDVTSVDCPTITIKESRQAGDYRFTAVVQGVQPLSQPRFIWKAIGRDQQMSSIIDRDIPFTGQGTASILIKEKDQDSGIFLMLHVTVTGYDPSCKASASGGGFPEPTPTPDTSAQTGGLIASPQSVVLPCQDGFTPATCSQNSTVIRLSLNSAATDRTYTWYAEFGKITGQGVNATWDLSGVQPGTYKAKVDQQESGGRVTAYWSTIVTVENCKDCRNVLPCFTVHVTCPDSVREGDPIAFTANVSGGASTSDLRYNWSVSNGKIISGQNTQSIKVDADGVGGKEITATVEIGGIGPECVRTASCTSSILPPAQPCRKFDEFGKIRYGEQQARLDNYAIEIQNNPNTTAYIIGSTKGKSFEGRKRAETAQKYLVNSRGIDARRIEIVEDPTRSSSSVELWICPPGAKVP